MTLAEEKKAREEHRAYVRTLTLDALDAYRSALAEEVITEAKRVNELIGYRDWKRVAKAGEALNRWIERLADADWKPT